MFASRTTLHLLAALLFLFLRLTAFADASQPYLVAMTLSGNSSNMIADAFQSAVVWVDSIVLIDTGITDDTLETARRIAGDKLITRNIKWPGSFSDARNKALQLAAELGGVWGVFLDTDERFEGNTSTIRDFLQSTTADMINMKHDSLTYQKVRTKTKRLPPSQIVSLPSQRLTTRFMNALCTPAQPRFFRLPVRGTYVGPTHEFFSLAPGATSADMSSAVFSELPKSDEGNR